jgi:ketosteroid isomerase-like protein
MAGMNIRRGRDAFKANTDAGRILYREPESATNEHLAVIAEGDWVAVLLKRRARTNKVDDYENLYGMFYEVIDGKIATQVEILEFRVAADKFDLSALPQRG